LSDEVKFIAEDTRETASLYIQKVDAILSGTVGHMTIMIWKVDPRSKKRAGILAKESSTKAVEM
jgi:hypothetical protein